MSRYTNERNSQIILGLLKEYGIRKIIVSPGSTNISIAGSVQNDPWFEVYSSVDERSAAYMACGLAEMSGEAVVISCTGATASRNYLPGLTEAYYRKLPVIALTSTPGNDKIGNLIPQMIDRTVMPADTVVKSIHLPRIHDARDEAHCTLMANRALHAAFANGGGPVHINLPTAHTGVFNFEELPPVRVIRELTAMDEWPDLANLKIAVFIGSHRHFSAEEVAAIEDFCAKHNAAVLCDHTSSYKGNYRVQPALVGANFRMGTDRWKAMLPDIALHLGEVSGDYYGVRALQEAKEVWRISEDGQLRDISQRLKYIYSGDSLTFFKRASAGEAAGAAGNSYLNSWRQHDADLRAKMSELPYSNVWLAQQSVPVLPAECNLYFGILNSLRSWNFFDLPAEVSGSSNVGGFGIDGCMSTLIGGALASPDRINIGIIGDLAFFYDINALGNRHLGDNVRIMLVNNGCGVEFNNSSHIASQYKSGANKLIAAAGHFNSGEAGTEKILPSAERMQRSLAKAWCEARGMNYLRATSKDEFLAVREDFFKGQFDGPVLMECFTEVADESRALEMITSIDPTKYEKAAAKAKKVLSPQMRAKARQAVKKLTT